MPFMNPLFAYFSPETMLPATSILATVVGIFMMFGKGTVRLIVGAWRRVLLRPRATSLRGPHFSIGAEASASRMTPTPVESTQEAEVPEN